VVYVSSASVTYRDRTDYARSKTDAEALVRAEAGLEHTIVRPTLVYDKAGALEIEMFARCLRALPVVPFIGDGSALKRPVYAGDIIHGLAAIPGCPASRGRTYNFSGGEAVTMIELARLILRQFGIRRVIVPVPEAVWRLALGALSGLVGSPALARQIIAGFTEDADLDPSEAMRDLGYDPLPARVGIPRHFHAGAR
jgi:NADH dehydrogenase